MFFRLGLNPAITGVSANFESP